MADVSYTDHDLLVLSLERIAALTKTLDAWMISMSQEFKDLKERVTLLERQEDRQSGFFSGAKFIWALIGTLPPSIILVLSNIKF